MNCYLCSSQLNLFIVKQGFQIYRCQKCGLSVTDFKENYGVFVRQHYNKGYFSGDPIRSGYYDYQKDKNLITKNMKKFLNEIQKYKLSGKLLDVGCAMGYFIKMAIDEGFDAYGFDPSEYAIDEAKKIVDGRAHSGTIQSVTFRSGSFDVISMFDVFEHLVDPRKDLSKLKTLLQKEGIIVIATGNSDSLMARIMRRRWTFYNPPQHLFFFTKSTLKKLLEEIGFQPLHWFTIGKWVSLRYVLHLAHTAGESTFAKSLYEIFALTKIGELPLYIPLHDNMVVIAKKYE